MDLESGPMLGEIVVQDGLTSVSEACEFLGIGRSLLYELMNEGLLDSVKLGRRRLIPRKALIAVATRNLRRGAVTLSAAGDA